MISQGNAIQTRRLAKSLGGRTVLREIDLEIAAAECVALLGGNGAGKTTLLRCLAAIARPTSGEVFWFGQPAAAKSNQRSLVGMVTHESRLYAHLTLRENLVFAARMCAVTAPRQRTNTLLEQTGLQALADRQVRQISRGMRQRLALARSLIHDPPILLLDEPFSGLDTKSRDWLVRLLRVQQASGRALCFATHQQELVRQLADRTLTLRNGSLTDHKAMTKGRAKENVWQDAA